MDTNYNSGIVITEEQCKNYTTSDDKLQFKSLPDALIENQLSSLALNKAAENKLQTIVNQEKSKMKTAIWFPTAATFPMKTFKITMNRTCAITVLIKPLSFSSTI